MSKPHLDSRRPPKAAPLTPARALHPAGARPSAPWTGARPEGHGLIVLAYAGMCLIWGSTWMIIKIGLRGAPPMTGVALRFLIAGAVVAGVLLARRISIPKSRKAIFLSLFLGVFQLAVPYCLVYWGEQRISSGLTAVLYSTMPLVVAVLARTALGDVLTPRKLAGIILGIAGVAVIFADNLGVAGAEGGRGIVAVLVSVCCAGVSSVALKKYGKEFHPLALLVRPFFIAGVLVTAVAAPVEHSNPLQYDAATWGTILYLALVGSVVAFSLFFWAVQRIDVTVVTYQTFIIPIIAVLLGWVFLGETLSLRAGLGALVILAGIALATLRPRRVAA